MFNKDKKQQDNCKVGDVKFEYFESDDTIKPIYNDVNVKSYQDMLHEIILKAEAYDSMIKPFRNKEICCSFCGKSQSAVNSIIAGPGVYICNECVALCSEILEDEIEEQKAPVEDKQ